jgi:predicted negative regulator of RcsB-dependent stress response
LVAQLSGNKMNDNVVNKKSFISQVTEIVKTNIRNIIILLSLSFVLFLSYQIYSFYISNKIQKNSIAFFAAQNTEDTNVINDTITKLSNDDTFYSVLAKLELIDLNLKQNNIQDSISMYLEVINQNNLDSVYKSAIASKASYQLIDINLENLSSNYLNAINNFISYIDEEANSYKGIKLELKYLIKILEVEKNSIDYSSFNEVSDIYENIMSSDVVSSAIKERVNKIHEFYSNK